MKSLRNMTRAQLLVVAGERGLGLAEGLTKATVLVALLEKTPVADQNDTVTTSPNGFVEKIVDAFPIGDVDMTAIIDGLDEKFATLGAYDPSDPAILHSYIMKNVLGVLNGYAMTFGPKDNNTYVLRIEGPAISIAWVFGT